MTGTGSRIREYDESLDLDAVLRIWLEIGWLERAGQRDALGSFLAGGQAEVGLIDDVAECAVHWAPGSIIYEQTALQLCAVTAVTTSHIGRRQGFATTMTARALAAGHRAGAAVAALGMFDQGFYDRLGFAIGDYEYRLTFDPASLLVDRVDYRTPVRLGLDDHAEIHAAMVRRARGHGSVVLDPPELTRGEIGFLERPVGLGYRDESGELTHFVLGELSGEHGPWRITAIAHRDRRQLLELLRLIHEMGDQVRSVSLPEPADIQLQALLAMPMRERDRSRGTVHESSGTANAWWQLRILDLAECVAARTWSGDPVRFNLEVLDPLATVEGVDWAGVGGDYTIEIGRRSWITTGHEPGLGRLRAGVGAFSRLWFGVRSASVLAATDDLVADDDLLRSLDRSLALPRPVVGWSF